ncbi:putative membrane protein [[Clostridium] sordellii ATCC 9714]|nr:putative membrane protein [[Clostridium] sordellii ATCC 9714] [Paeniclostridium sordellii ATCC 9714]
MIALLAFKKPLKNKFNVKYEKACNLAKEISKFGLILPLGFLLAPILNLNSPIGIYVSISAISLFIYFIGRLIFKEDSKQIGFYALVSVVAIILDSLLGSYLMKNSIMSYDAIVGARYYGIGNEYQGITIGSSIIAMAILIKIKSFLKYLYL